MPKHKSDGVVNVFPSENLLFLIKRSSIKVNCAEETRKELRN